ncbi:MAG: Glycosyl transferase family 9 [Candidatus Peregrinibacteria bacterium GW2011_GWA2_43_8]|nr:MAG: Glycosyl transferase family 9 [Candidatus Peregrinibacteria bacterium GW2011_GWA2_43_8]
MREPYLRISGLLTRFLGKAQVGFDHGLRGRLYGEKIAYNDQQHAVLTFCDLLRPLRIDYKPEKLTPLKVTDEVLKNCKNKLESLFGCELHEVRIIGIHAGTAESAKYRAWPKENFAKLIQKLIIRDKTIRVVLTGSKGEHQTNEEIMNMVEDKKHVFNLAGVLSFEEFISLFSYIDRFVSNDTGPMHLAAAQGCKTIGLFGPNLPLRFGPYGQTAIYHGDKLPCSPCINIHKGKFVKCKRIKNGCAECMRMIEVEEVDGRR